MPDVPRQFGKPLPPTNWPQDTLSVPSAFGLGSDIDVVNAASIKREFYALTVAFPTVAYKNNYIQTIQVPNSGDFWMTAFGMNGYNIATGAITTLIDADVFITDNKTGYQFYSGGVPYRAVNFVATGSNQPNGRFIQLISEPYCFVRDGSITVEIQMQNLTTNASTFALYGVFLGWQEYKNVAK
jgi:hypothetical protein